MYIIDASYFQADKTIPNALELNSNVNTILEQFIDNKVRLLLKNALGYELFNDLDSNITDGVLDVGAPVKWENLVNGVEYTKGTETLKWQGLKFTEGTIKHSLLADFVYYYWLENEAIKNTGVGLVTVTSKNATNVSYNSTLTRHWNNFIIQYQGELYNYNTWLFDFSWCKDNNYVSLLQFLKDNDTDYNDATLRIYNFKNEFGI